LLFDLFLHTIPLFSESKLGLEAREIIRFDLIQFVMKIKSQQMFLKPPKIILRF